MCQAREEERVKILGVSGTRNNTSGKDISNFIALFGPQVQDDPNVNPAIRLLAAIKLCTVDREYNNCVVFANVTVLDAVKII
jgi:hypothetical protein